MDTVVYPDARVQAALEADFAGFKLCLTERHPDFKESILGRPVGWAPTFLFTDGKGREVRRSVGWRSTDDFLGELAVVRGRWDLLRARFDDALEVLESVRGRLAPEAGYWAGVTLFLRGKRDMGALKDRWNRLRAEHPGHDWSEKASVVDDLP